ncbi:hypothetical protein BCR43DRAFT_484418 [Syncephalastrum racemosum]|uniref:Small nuclear ribonucleoprotein Prp3 C-terminal domain-containing protein n=1 Tax=Syncephalastrum racemosum TaxID=13706 RepID=A0A1X2HKL6_SYNRA|nr:hypothetical protein BCR43DRAFT_484418 [Syncephalastrum racemosum]
MEDACSVVELLQSMYYGEDEFRFRTDGDQELFEQLQAGTPCSKPASIVFEIRLPLAGEGTDRLTLVCSVAAHSDNYELSVASGANATWLSREAHEQLTASLANHTVDPDMDRASQLTEKIQHVLELAESVYQERQLQMEQQAEAAAAAKEPARFMREWIWFPMIYTREKRGHIIDWAPKYGITGFLCPGKPGCLCLEGSEKDVARFINDIKTVSWADIPASHRKMTTKWQERALGSSLDEHRKFPDMIEVTFDLHGAFGNHNDLDMLKRWMADKNCGDAFEHLFDTK